jgi:coenzyme Q-binding protein COQ10
MTEASRSVVVDVPPEQFYEVVTDFQHYPEFVKELSDVRIDSEGDNEWTITFSVSLIKKFEYTLNLKGVPGKSVKWSLAKKGFMKKNDGSWSLTDLGDGRTEATYAVDVNMGMLAPKSVVNMLVASNFPTMLKAFKERAEKGA